jgi:hypothetical protein
VTYPSVPQFLWWKNRGLPPFYGFISAYAAPPSTAPDR